jgi:hypothetical protein
LSAVLVLLGGTVGYYKFVRAETILLPQPEPTATATKRVSLPVLATTSRSEGLFETGDWRGKPALVDLDGDGKLDLVSALRRWNASTAGEGIHVWLGDGTGKWRAKNEGLRRDMGYGGVDIADFDGDGRPDIAFSGHNVKPHVFLNCLDQEQGGFATTAEGLDLEVVCIDVAAGDLDGDGHPDLVTLGQFPQEGGMLVYKGDGRGGFSRMVELLPPLHYGAQLRVVDLEGDGKNELIAMTDLGPRVWRHDPAQGLIDVSDGLPAPAIGGSDLGIVALDLDGDGRLELVCAGLPYEGHPSLRAFRRDGDRWVDFVTELPDQEPYYDIEIARLGRDKPSLVLGSKHGITILDMTAPGKFAARGVLAGSEGCLNVGAGDIDADGVDEIVFVGFGAVRVLAVDAAAIRTPKVAEESIR